VRQHPGSDRSVHYMQPKVGHYGVFNGSRFRSEIVPRIVDFFILDNLNDKAKLWNETPYRYLKRQASEHTGRWVTIRGESAPLVGSVTE
jgi:hypothetical protein